MKKKRPGFILIALGGIIFFCVLCVVSYPIMDSMGLIPTDTSTPTPTPSATPTATQTSTPTETLTPLPPTITLTPTMKPGEILDEAVTIACKGNFAIPREVASTTDQPGARLCPSFFVPITLPEEWTAKTLDSLRYIVNIETGTTPVRNCNYEGGLTVKAEQSYHKITVYNSMTGAVVREKIVSGPNNVYCPVVYKIGGFNDLTGDFAPLPDVEKAMIALLRALLPARP